MLYCPRTDVHPQAQQMLKFPCLCSFRKANKRSRGDLLTTHKSLYYKQDGIFGTDSLTLELSGSACRRPLGRLLGYAEVLETCSYLRRLGETALSV